MIENRHSPLSGSLGRAVASLENVRMSNLEFHTSFSRGIPGGRQNRLQSTN